MAQRSKLSGAALAAELSDLSFPQSGPQPASLNVKTAMEAPSPALGPADIKPVIAAPRTAPPLGKRPAADNPRGGRPAKAGVDGIPVNVRLSQADHLALAKLAGKLMVPGRPLPTVQDVVRSLIRGALNEPDLAFRLSNRTE